MGIYKYTISGHTIFSTCNTIYYEYCNYVKYIKKYVSSHMVSEPCEHRVIDNGRWQSMPSDNIVASVADPLWRQQWRYWQRFPAMTLVSRLFHVDISGDLDRQCMALTADDGWYPRRHRRQPRLTMTDTMWWQADAPRWQTDDWRWSTHERHAGVEEKHDGRHACVGEKCDGLLRFLTLNNCSVMWHK